jgi:hypothetical protein
MINPERILINQRRLAAPLKNDGFSEAYPLFVFEKTNLTMREQQKDFVLTGTKDFVRRRESEEIIIRKFPNRGGLDSKRYAEIKEKMLNKTIESQKEAVKLSEGGNHQEKKKRLRELTKGINERDHMKEEKRDRWVSLRFTDSLPNNFGKFKSKKLKELKEYLKKSEGAQEMKQKASASESSDSESLDQSNM